MNANKTMDNLRKLVFKALKKGTNGSENTERESRFKRPSSLKNTNLVLKSIFLMYTVVRCKRSKLRLDISSIYIFAEVSL